MHQHIIKVLDDLLLDESILDKCFDVCSGGEQKRIAIAQELMSLHKPSFMFIDEPTTGLDSNSALVVTRSLRKLADNNRMTILASIHTPNSDTLNMFDKLYILAKGGVCIYSGPPNFLRENLKNKLNLEIEQHKPPIEEYIRIACNGKSFIQYERILISII